MHSSSSSSTVVPSSHIMATRTMLPSSSSSGSSSSNSIVVPSSHIMTRPTMLHSSHIIDDGVYYVVQWIVSFIHSKQ